MVGEKNHIVTSDAWFCICRKHFYNSV